MKQYVFRIGAAAIGTIYVIAVSRTQWKVLDTIGGLVVASFFIVYPGLLTLALISNRRIRELLWFLGLGLAIGVIADMAGDPKPRNLFPIEIVAWCFITAPAWLAVVLTARGFRRQL